MARTLDVYLHRDLVGRLIQDDGGQMVFDYSKNWIENPRAVPLSQSLPLREERFKRSECRGFFAGLLPEEGKREIIARNLGISSQNDFSFLEEIGGECAGAITFVPSGEPFPEINYQFKELNEDEVAEILRSLPQRPLLAGNEDMRLSLAGAQAKIAVKVIDELIAIPLGGAPSSHIVKPQNEHFQGLVFNEYVCMKLAHMIGLPTSCVEIRRAREIEFLLVERYDRALVDIGTNPFSGGMFGPPLRNYVTRRLHQEDFCQALGIPPDKKYQKEEGPSLKQCFQLLREISFLPAVDLQNFLDAIVFNLLIGNNDAHSKNFSFIYEKPGIVTKGLINTRGMIRLAPLYDLVSTVYYPDLSPKMAMKIGGEYISEKIFPEHFEALAKEAGMSAKAVVKRVGEVAEKVRSKLGELEMEQKTAREVISLINQRCEMFLNRFRK